jgi:hypothetical protein
MQSQYSLHEIASCIRNINLMIERESKSSSYKFALLRAMIEVIQEQSPFLRLQQQELIVPMGLLIEKWMLYYYPLLLDIDQTPQNTGESQVVFFEDMRILQLYYENKAAKGLSVFYNDLRYKGVPIEIGAAFKNLAQSIRTALVNGPMKHLGQSIYQQHYGIFKLMQGSNLRKSKEMNRAWLIKNAGTFSIPRLYHDSFYLFGSFLNGDNSLLMHWANFSAKLGRSNGLELGSILTQMMESPILEHEVYDARKFYDAMEHRICIWSGKSAGTNYEVDHLLPFSIMRNNDLWNLFPATRVANNQKRDKIPVSTLLDSAKKQIFQYWELVRTEYPKRFDLEFKLALTGDDLSENWKEDGFAKIKESCKYLIEVRGFEPWDYK